MRTEPEVVATYEDKYGDERAIRKTRLGLKLKRARETDIMARTRIIARECSKRIKQHRLAKGWSLEECAEFAGIRSGHPKSRMWEIENPPVKDERTGVRLGTLFNFARAFGVELPALLPTMAEVEALLDGESRNAS